MPAKKNAKKNTGETRKPSKKFIAVIITALVAVVVAISAAVLIAHNLKNRMVGTYDLTEMIVDEEDQSASLEVLNSLGLYASLEVKEGGSGVLDLFGEKSEFTYDTETFTFDDNNVGYTFENDKITFDEEGATLVFTRHASE